MCQYQLDLLLRLVIESAGRRLSDWLLLLEERDRLSIMAELDKELGTPSGVERGESSWVLP